MRDVLIGIPPKSEHSLQEDWHSALSKFAGLNPTVTDAGICISSPVRGLRPLRDARDLRVNVPNPVIETEPSVFTPSAIASSTKALQASILYSKLQMEQKIVLIQQE